MYSKNKKIAVVSRHYCHIPMSVLQVYSLSVHPTSKLTSKNFRTVKLDKNQ